MWALTGTGNLTIFHISPVHPWERVTPGPHTMVSRVTDAEGNVQPTADELKRKKTFLEDNSQFPRKITIS